MTPHQRALRNSSLLPPGIPRWFAALGLMIGASYAVLVGPLRVADEAGHMYRSYLVSEGFCTGVPALGKRPGLGRLERFPWIQLSRRNTGRDLLDQVDDAHDRPLSVVSWFYAVNLYSCIPYLPAGAAFRLGRTFSAPPLTLMYLGRFANLLFYLAVIVGAMRLLPEFQLPIALLALMPMSLHQAASLAADGVTIAVSFLMTAYILRLALSDQPVQLQRSDYLLLVVGAVIAGLCKSNAGLVFLLLLIPGARFPDRRTRWLVITGYILLAFGTAAIWQYIDRPNGEIYSTLKAAAGIRLDENAAVIFQRPAIFLNAIGRTVVVMGWDYLQQFVGRLGWADIRLPVWIPSLYLVLLVVAASAGRVAARLSVTQRILLVGVFLVNLAAIMTAFWTTETPRESIASNATIISIFGRYLIPFAPLPLIAISGIGTQLRKWIVVPALALVVVVNAVALNLVWDRFQAHSSTIPNRIRMALRHQFASTPETAALLYDQRFVSSRTPGAMTFLVTGGARHLASTITSITFRGYEWPDDIILLSDQELAAIPLGAPLELPRDYEGQLVRRTGSSVEDSKVYLVREGKKHWVINSHWISSHGYKWPDDVHIIPAPDLATIPEGDAIQ